MAFDKNQINQSIADFSVKKLLTDLLDAVTGGSFNDVTATAAEINRAADTDTITLNGGSRGGLIGDTIRLVDIDTNQWVVHGVLKQSGAEATPFSATVA